MGELIILDDWKRQKELADLADLETELAAWMTYLDVKREFFIFDSEGIAFQIFPSEAE